MTFGFGLSMYHTLRCVLYHGCFLNELIERIRTGDDKALFDAIRIDSTVTGCIAQAVGGHVVLRIEAA